MKKLLVVLVLLTGLFFAAREFVRNPPARNVAAAAETAPVPHPGDAADDPAIWVDPDDPTRSVVIGTDKKGGLSVFDLDGRALQVVDTEDRFNNVDLRPDVPWRGESIVLVAAGAKEGDRMVLFRLDPTSRSLTPLDEADGGSFAVGVDPEGVALGRDAASGAVSVFTVGPDLEGEGEERFLVEQWRLSTGADAGAPPTCVRRLVLGGEAEGLVVDDAHGALFVAEENAGIWRFSAAPDAEDDRTLVATVGRLGSLRHDVEGLAIWAGPNGGGYLVASSQGSDDFVVYERTGDHAVLGRFEVVAGAVDAVTHTDGIEVTSTPLGPRYPRGLLVVQDDENDDQNQNFKLVPWHLVAERLGLDADE